MYVNFYFSYFCRFTLNVSNLMILKMISLEFFVATLNSPSVTHVSGMVMVFV